VSTDAWNLVHIITKLELGGAQLATLHQVEHSQFATGARYLLHGPGGMLDREARRLARTEAIEVPALDRDVEPRSDFEAIQQLAGLLWRLRRQRPNERWLVHTHSSKAGILGRWAARGAGCDLVIHSIHGFGHTTRQRPALRAALLAAEQATAVVTDGFTADSEANIAQGRREGIIDRVPARVVRCAIDIPAFSEPARPRSDTRRELGVPDDHVVALNLSCLKPQKDPETYVRLARQVVAVHPKTTFLIAGDGELRDAVAGLTERYGLREHLRLLGWRRDVPDLLHAADMLVLTSLWEGLPQVFPQAMAAGLPIVATRVDGAPEAIEHGVTGLLYDVGDVDGMAAGICELVTDRRAGASFGAAGRQRVEAFSNARMIADLDGFYDELVSHEPPRSLARAERGVRLARRWLEGALRGVGSR
jgi:glycosyltransferase involved in cell wall biosynthesis